MSAGPHLLEHGVRGATKLRDQAYESFTQKLLASEIRPGQFLSQRELVVLTGMPLGAIRELIPRLEGDSLIETVPQRGMQVTSIDLKLVRNAFQLWMTIEKAAAAHFTEFASDAVIDEQAAAHEEFLEKANEQLDDKLLDEAERIDWALHDSFIECLGNELLSNVYRVNRIRICLIELERLTHHPRAAILSMQEHMKILEALKARDVGGVVAAVEAHLESSLRRAVGI